MIKKIITKKKSLSNPKPIFKKSLKYFNSLALSLTIFKILNNLTIFTNLYILPILVILILSFKFPELISKSKGTIDKKSIVNHPHKYYLAI